MTASDASMFVLPTVGLEIIDIARNLKPSKSPGYDEISPKVIKSIINNIAQPISDIFNLSLRTGIFSDKLKTAKVSSDFKSDNKKLVNNYRPISILPVFSKTLEKFMYNRLLSYLDKINILTDKQYGFRENYSTYMAIINLVDQISNELDKKHCTLGIFIDLSKEFDTINHTILLDKLPIYGIRGLSNDWFKSYLSNCNQYVQIDNTRSNILPFFVMCPRAQF